MSKKLIHYLNQFFGGIGREEAANYEPHYVEGPVGPGTALQAALGDELTIVGTIICGDNYINEHHDEAVGQIIAMIREHEADILFAGPGFESGRYGLACGEVCVQVQKQTGIMSVPMMSEKNPAAEIYRKELVILSGADKALRMRQDIAHAAEFLKKLAAGKPLSSAGEDGYIPTGLRRIAFRESRSADRAVEMLLAKMAKKPFKTEIELPSFEKVDPVPAIGSLKDKLIALVSTGGIVAKGNPEHLETTRCTKWVKYDISGMERLSPDDFQCIHGGYENTFANDDPNRVVPLDAMRILERKEGFRLFNGFYAYCGAMGVLDTAKKIAHEIIMDMTANGIEAIILTST